MVSYNCALDMTLPFCRSTVVPARRRGRGHVSGPTSSALLGRAGGNTGRDRSERHMSYFDRRLRVREYGRPGRRGPAVVAPGVYTVVHTVAGDLRDLRVASTAIGLRCSPLAWSPCSLGLLSPWLMVAGGAAAVPICLVSIVGVRRCYPSVVIAVAGSNLKGSQSVKCSHLPPSWRSSSEGSDTSCRMRIQRSGRRRWRRGLEERRHDDGVGRRLPDGGARPAVALAYARTIGRRRDAVDGQATVDAHA